MTSTDIVDETAAVVERLLPCPFCGGEPYASTYMDEDLATHDIVEWKKCGCLDCGVSFQIPDGYEGGTAADQWNTRAASRERDTGVPEGFWLAPIKPTDEIITAAAEAHFGKRRTVQSGGIDGIGMTVAGKDFSFRDAFKAFWKGARSAAPQPPSVSPIAAPQVVTDATDDTGSSSAAHLEQIPHIAGPGPCGGAGENPARQPPDQEKSAFDAHISEITRELVEARKALAENQSDVSSFLTDYERGPGYISVPTHRLERLDRINRAVLSPKKDTAPSAEVPA